MSQKAFAMTELAFVRLAEIGCGSRTVSQAPQLCAGDGMFLPCFYCEYRVHRYHFWNFVLCDWCNDYVDEGGEPNDVAHWWSSWRRKHNTYSPVVTRCVPFEQELRDIILSFLVGTRIVDGADSW